MYNNWNNQQINKLNLDINPSKTHIIFNKSKALLIESNNKEINKILSEILPRVFLL